MGSAELMACRAPCQAPGTAVVPPVLACCYYLPARRMSVFTMSHAATIPSTNNTALTITKRLGPRPVRSRGVRTFAGRAGCSLAVLASQAIPPSRSDARSDLLNVRARWGFECDGRVSLLYR